MTNQVNKEISDYIDSLPGPAVYKDEQCVFQYLNSAYGDLIGLRQHLDFIGGTAFDLPCGASASAGEFEAQDRHVVSSGRGQQILDIHSYVDGQWGVHLGIKSPWRDENQKIIGSIWQGTDITNAYTLAVTSQLAKFTGHLEHSYTLTDDGGAVSLSPRESEVLFLILRGKTAKLAATVLGLSYRTVQQYIETLKMKFGVDSKIELIDAAMARGYLSQIPLSVFSKQLSIVLAME